MTPARVGTLVFFTIVIGPLFTAPGYSVQSHSISELGAQTTPNSWIMNVGFVSFGIGVLPDAVMRFRSTPIGALSFSVFGLSMILTGFFSHRPIDLSLPYDVVHDQLHTFFSGAIGTSFAVGTLSFAFSEPARLAKVACAAASASVER